MHREHQDGQVGTLGQKVLNQIDTGAPGQCQIAQNQVRLAREDGLQSSRSIRSLSHHFEIRLRLN